MKGLPTQPQPRETEAVVLVHGLWMNGWWDQFLLRRRLRRCGYRVYRFHYPTVRRGIPANAEGLAAFVAACPEPTLHFVAHSLGGRVVREYLHRHLDARPGRVVTLGTPHNGSVVAARLARFRWGRLVLGRSVAPGGLLEGGPPWPPGRPLLSIAGTRPVGLGLITGPMPGAHDGTVRVEETEVAGARHTGVNTTHTGLLFSAPALRAACGFLQGRGKEPA